MILKIVGVLLLLLPVIGLYIYLAKQSDIKIAAITLGIASAATAIIIACLITGLTLLNI